MENLEHAPTAAVPRDPSYPDRQRIDSDVRAFLRPVSSPWIVFDRDSRADFGKRALRIGAVFASSAEILPPAESSEAAAPEAPAAPPAPAMFPPSTFGRPAEAQEPSTVAVSSDVVDPRVQVDAPRAMPEPRPAFESDPFAVPPGLRRTGRGGIFAGAALAVVALAVLAGVGISRVKPAVKPASAAAAVVAPPADVAPPAEEADLIPPPPPAFTAAAELPSASASGASVGASAIGKESSDPKKRFGKLTIKGSDPKLRNVWFDGKRMLGSGNRSFMVFCGMHTVAIADKTDAKDIEIPCNGEYVVK